MSVVIVLSDQETFSDLEGAFALEVPENFETQDIERALKHEEIVCSDVWTSEDGSQGLPFGKLSPEQIQRIESD